ncbi:STAS domain-containing protein [Seleniivibrio woodruffii]|uniref:STAS domain-containing protein n=1 Tax=Seleniivibrio woodruffii TaxID=1078050 RepID=UPI0026EB9440|nr:STAS domain-containing protein [Seleniivibrio woodruffii]
MIEMRMEKQADGKTILHLSGELTISNVRPLYERVCEGLKAPEELTVHIGNVDAIDCTFLQVLCTAHRAYTAKGKSFCVKLDDCGIIGKAGWSGIAPGKKCAKGLFGTCFLIQEGE